MKTLKLLHPVCRVAGLLVSLMLAPYAHSQPATQGPAPKWWHNAVIYEMGTRRMVFGRFAVGTAYHRLWGRAWGEPVDPARHMPAVEPKGARVI